MYMDVKKSFYQNRKKNFVERLPTIPKSKTVKESENNIDQTPPPPLLGFSNKVRFYNSTIYYIPLLISELNFQKAATLQRCSDYWLIKSHRMATNRGGTQ